MNRFTGINATSGKMKKLLQEIKVLTNRLDSEVEKKILMLQQVIRMKEELRALRDLFRGLESKCDDARGKRCPDCEAPLVNLPSMNLRMCSGCGVDHPWHLDPGQAPLIGNNRQGRTYHDVSDTQA